MYILDISIRPTVSILSVCTSAGT